jgi:hypothetical protein
MYQVWRLHTDSRLVADLGLDGVFELQFREFDARPQQTHAGRRQPEFYIWRRVPPGGWPRGVY